jgi:hypothetical protein
MTGSAKVSEKAANHAAFILYWIDFFGTKKMVTFIRYLLKEKRGKDKHVERVA